MTSSSSPGQTIIARDNAYSTLDNINTILPGLIDLNIDYTREDTLIQNYKVLVLYGFDVINNMILNVIYTEIGERDFEPTFGSKALNLLFEPNDSFITDTIQLDLYDRITYWVPYVSLLIDGIIINQYYDQQTVELIFIYTEKVSGIQSTFTTYLSNRQTLFHRGD